MWMASNLGDPTASNDLTMCVEAAKTHFIQVGDSLVQVDLHPFLSHSQVQDGHGEHWFEQQHLDELLALLQPVIESFVTRVSEGDQKKKSTSKDCVLTGNSVRVACVFKTLPQRDIYLLPAVKKTKKRTADKPKGYEHRSLHNEKLVVYVCPRAQSTVLQLSQFVSEESARQHEDISHYFQQFGKVGAKVTTEAQS